MDTIKRIQQLLEFHGWSEYRLAKESGLSQSTISNIFTRNTTPSITTLDTICSAFGITLAQFFADDSSLVHLTDEQQALLKIGFLLTPKQKQAVFAVIDAMIH